MPFTSPLNPAPLHVFFSALSSPLPPSSQVRDTCAYVTRRFIEVSKHNPCVFVEALFHIRPADCTDILEA
jgi:hypothetical protein